MNQTREPVEVARGDRVVVAFEHTEVEYLVDFVEPFGFFGTTDGRTMDFIPARSILRKVS